LRQRTEFIDQLVLVFVGVVFFGVDHIIDLRRSEELRSSVARRLEQGRVFTQSSMRRSLSNQMQSETTDVSRSPRVGSVIDALVDHRIEACTKPLGVDPRRAGCRLGKRRSEHEAPWPNGPQLCNRSAVACYDYRPAGLYFAKHGCDERSTCSTL
jgi:hypothetical protein